MPSDPEPFDPRPFADGLRQLNQREQTTTTERAASARTEAQHLAERIAAEVPGVRRVYLFGSLLKDTPGHPDFDIDLAVAGGDIYGAMAVCESSSWRIDLVDIERVTRSVAERIERYGQILYPR